MKKAITPLTALPLTGMGAVDKAWDAVWVSFDRFGRTAGMEAVGTMMEQDAERACGARHARSDGRRGHGWGRTQGKIGFHVGKVAVERPRVRDLEGHELSLPSWERAVTEDWLGKWAMNLMLINVSTRKFRRAVRLPEGDVPAPAGAGVSKSAASRHFVALSAARMKEWVGADLSGLDIMVVQIEGVHICLHLVLVAALGIDSEGFKHPLGLMEGATEHSAVVQALIDDIIENMMGTVRRVTRNVKRWSSSSMALRWTAAAMNEAKKGFRRLKAYKQLPALRVALAAHYEKETNNRALVQTAKAA